VDGRDLLVRPALSAAAQGIDIIIDENAPGHATVNAVHAGPPRVMPPSALDVTFAAVSWLHGGKRGSKSSLTQAEY